MIKIQQTELELKIISIAQKHDMLPELCRWMEYHPDYGRVEPFWQPHWHVIQLAKELIND